MKNKIDRDAGICLDTATMQFYTADGTAVVDMPYKYHAKVRAIMDAEPDDMEEQLREIESEAEQDNEIWEALEESVEE